MILEVKKTIIYSETIPERLDKFVSSKHPDFSRRFFQIAIKKEEILVNNKAVSSNYKLQKNDQIKIDIPTEEETKLEVLPDKNIPFKIIHQSKDFLIINKPAGISVHPSKNERFGTLVNGLLAKFPEIKGVGENQWRPGIVHRLDKETSGILIIAKNDKAFRYFKKLFQDRKVQKTYLAWVWGNIKEKEGEIVAHIGRSNQNPTKQAVSHNPKKLINPKEATTKYKVIEKSANKSLVQLNPKTGRKHQIRLHLHSIGHPILGDKKYANKNVKKLNRQFDRHLLHAQKIEFDYLDKKHYKFEMSKMPINFL